jgi:DGQHR domain-containing protein
MSKILSFNSFIDSQDASKWMKNFLDLELKTANKHEDPDSQIELVDETRELVDVFFSEVNENNYNPNTDFLNIIWNKINELNDDTYAHQRQPEPISWGQWRVNRDQVIRVNNKETKVILANQTSPFRDYDEVPQSITWKLKKIVQKDIVFYTTSALINEIDKVCSVPALPIEMSSEESGLRVLDINRASNEWQRRPSPERINSIKEFVDFSENIIANSPMLFIKDNKSVKINDDELEINFQDFLFKNTDSEPICYSDYKKNELNSEHEDLRPIWLIDGQHRVRGLANSNDGPNLRIPIIIFPSEFSLAKAAKVFAEINTLQDSLKPLHKLFMQHRFKISSPIANRNFGDYNGVKESDKSNSRANHLSYELVAKLASRTNSVLYNKVKILDQNIDPDYYIKADIWVNYARTWFTQGPYSREDLWTKDKEEDIYNEVNNYFRAFVETVNHKSWSDKKKRWTDTLRNKSILQSSTHFKVLIDLYSDVYANLVPKQNKELFTIDDFKNILLPFKWVDWTSSDLRQLFGGGGEKGRTSLYIWMYDALQAKESHNLRAVMSKNIKSEPGKGILAPPNKSEIIVVGDWPEPNKPVEMLSSRPINARRKSRWSVEDNNGATYSQILKHIGNEESLLYYEPFMDDLKSIKITVSWSNAAQMDGTSSITLINNTK